MSLYSLIYVSRAAYPMSGDDLKAILQKSHTNNRTRNVTGMLLYRDERFMQVLEGNESDVMALYRTIAADKRHRGVYIVYQRPVKERTFHEWEMGFHDMEGITADDLPGYTDFLSQPLDTESLYDDPTRTMMFLQLFRDRVGAQ